jgi:hypothetical protein
VAFACIAVLAAALFTRTSRTWESRATGWALLGLVGAAIHVTNGMIANGLEILAFMDFGWLSDDPNSFWLVFRATRVLFTAEIVAWGLVIGGFSAAGWQSSTLPRWLTILGFLDAVACLACGVLIDSVLREGRAALLIEIASLGCLVWFLVTGVLMVLRGGTPMPARRTAE